MKALHDRGILLGLLLLAGCTSDAAQVDQLYDKASRQFSNGLAEEAIDTYTAVLKLNPKLGEAYLGRGCAYVADGKPEKALLDFERAEAMLGETQLLHKYRGIAYFELNRADQSIAALTEALRLHPNDEVALRGRGLAYELIGDLERAVADLSEAIRFDPYDATLYVDRAGFYLQLEEFSLALTDANQALAIMPSYAEAYMVRAMAHQGNQEWSLAKADHEAALRHDPSLRRFPRRGLMSDRWPVVRVKPSDKISVVKAPASV